MRRVSGFVLLLGLLGSGAPGRAAASSFTIAGVADLAAVRASGQPSWLAGGFGRLAAGAGTTSATRDVRAAELRLGAHWEAGAAWAFDLRGLARVEPGTRAGKAGLSEAFATWRHASGDAGEVRLRAGLFLLPTTREAVDPLWTSPYTLTLSALDTWIGEEVRPEGLDAAWKLGEHVTLGATAFVGNDAAGSLLAWRGWSLGNRLTTRGERLPLPPLVSFHDPEAFAEQRRRRGSNEAACEPIGRELDGRLGGAVRGRVEAGGLLLQASLWDNRGDRGFHRGEYAWRTKTSQLAAEWSRGGLTLAGEALRGSTGMGSLDVPHVDADFRSWYALASAASGAWRWSARYDRFATRDRDHSAAEDNDEDGHALTVAAFWSPRPRLRFGLEHVDLRARRPAAAQSGFDADTDGAQWTLAVRVRFE